MTIVRKYPVPIVDELLDELMGACWFLKLDLHVGYHQIRLAEGEEYKQLSPHIQVIGNIRSCPLDWPPHQLLFWVP